MIRDNKHNYIGKKKVYSKKKEKIFEEISSNSRIVRVVGDMKCYKQKGRCKVAVKKSSTRTYL